MNTCDVCGNDKNVITGRWIFYCPEHKQIDIDKIYDNELEPCLKSGEMPDMEVLEKFI